MVQTPAILLVVDTSRSTPVYVQIMDQVRLLVREGRLAAGMSLPSVRQLAQELEVNPNTIAKAYMLLEHEGILETLPRRGTFVAQSAADSATRAVDRRLDGVVDRIIEETSQLGIESGELLRALRKRLEEPDPEDSDAAGGKSP